MKIYEIENTFDHLCDMEYDITMMAFDNSKSFKNKLRQTDKIEISNQLNFLANFNITNNTDFPICNESMPVMSKKMLSIFESFHDFNSFVYPITLIDDTFLEEYFDRLGNIKPEVPINKRFQIVQPVEKLKLLDYELSDFEPMNEWELFPTIINKFVIKKPEGGFPPFFRVYEKPSRICVTQPVKSALENSGIKGCKFVEFG